MPRPPHSIARINCCVFGSFWFIAFQLMIFLPIVLCLVFLLAVMISVLATRILHVSCVIVWFFCYFSTQGTCTPI
jgi:hypothetical protein